MAQASVSLGLATHACAVTCGFECLGDDATILLASFLRARDLVNLQRCSKRLNLVSRHRDLWGSLVAIDFELSGKPQHDGLRTVTAAPARHVRESVLGAGIVEHPYLTCMSRPCMLRVRMLDPLIPCCRQALLHDPPFKARATRTKR